MHGIHECIIKYNNNNPTKTHETSMFVPLTIHITGLYLKSVLKLFFSHCFHWIRLAVAVLNSEYTIQLQHTKQLYQGTKLH